MKPPFTPIPVEALRARLSAAGFKVSANDRERGEEAWEFAHHRDPRYVVRVHCRSRGEAVESASIVALRLPPDADVLLNEGPVSLAGSVEQALDRMVDVARQAYAAINRRRLSADLSAQAHEVSVRSTRAALRRGSR